MVATEQGTKLVSKSKNLTKLLCCCKNQARPYTHLISTLPSRIAQLVKSPELQSTDHRFKPLCRRGVFWNRPLASFSLQIASVASEHYCKNNGGPNQWIIRVKISPRPLLRIHPINTHLNLWGNPAVFEYTHTYYLQWSGVGRDGRIGCVPAGNGQVWVEMAGLGVYWLCVAGNLTTPLQKHSCILINLIHWSGNHNRVRDVYHWNHRHVKRNHRHIKRNHRHIK